jgi:hypothetical protein
MLPRARTMLAAMFVTAILVTVVATTILPVPADSYVSTAALPRVELPLAEHARWVSPKEQSRMAAYARLDDEINQTRPVESSSNAPKTMDGGTSTYVKTQARWSENQVERAASGSSPTPGFEQPASNLDTKSSDTAATGNVNGASIATAKPPAPHGDTGVSLAPATNSGRNDCALSNRRIGFYGFRPAHSRFHAHHAQLRAASWQRTWASRRIIARSTNRGVPGTYSGF